MFAACLALVFVVADPPKKAELPEAAKKELKALEGKWQIVKGASAQGEADLKNLDAVCTIEGNRLTFTRGTRAEVVEVTALDLKTDPRCIDLTDVRAGRPPRVSEGVYRLDGDTLILAVADSKEGKIRPTNFDKPTDARIMVWTMKRAKE
jgi:uncharacterized protein (TIGR03067 family)